ncbi:hypothetical protein GGI00_001123 [Coemansia sp. RSA 2681]|nr:hypothetical protein GGI00_001123 [Coemansia sp. RSA 2681]
MWAASPRPASPSPPRAAQDRAPAIAADGDNCQSDACRRDGSNCSSSSLSLSPTLWEASQAQEARELVLSMERRYAHLLKLMQKLSFHRQNPLGSAMCGDYEHRIHQLALLINGQISQLRRLVSECELRLTRSASTQSRSSSLADWEEVHALSNNCGNPMSSDYDGDDNNSSGPKHVSCAESPPAKNLSTIRYRLLSEVNLFFTTELANIKASLAPVAVQLPSYPAH